MYIWTLGLAWWTVARGVQDLEAGDTGNTKSLSSIYGYPQWVPIPSQKVHKVSHGVPNHAQGSQDCPGSPLMATRIPPGPWMPLLSTPVDKISIITNRILTTRWIDNVSGAMNFAPTSGRSDVVKSWRWFEILLLFLSCSELPI